MNAPVPSISIIIPARNEERFLPGCLESIRLSAAKIQESIEIVVVVNRSTDRTEEIAVQAGCVAAHNDSKNLSRIRNAGAAVARGEILVTIDADSRMSPGMLPAVVRALANPKVVGGGCFFVTDRISLGILLTGLCLVPFALKHRISAGLFYCRKSDFDAIGGFNEELVSVEDVDFARRLKAHGIKTGRKFKTILSAYLRTSARKFDQFGDWYFLRHPKFFSSLLRGTDEKAANVYWYDCER